MTIEIELNTALESYETLKALVERREKLEKCNDEVTVKALDEIIKQFEGYPCYKVLIEN